MNTQNTVTMLEAKIANRPSMDESTRFSKHKLIGESYPKNYKESWNSAIDRIETKRDSNCGLTRVNNGLYLYVNQYGVLCSISKQTQLDGYTFYEYHNLETSVSESWLGNLNQFREYLKESRAKKFGIVRYESDKNREELQIMKDLLLEEFESDMQAKKTARIAQKQAKNANPVSKSAIDTIAASLERSKAKKLESQKQNKVYTKRQLIAANKQDKRFRESLQTPSMVKNSYIPLDTTVQYNGIEFSPFYIMESHYGTKEHKAIRESIQLEVYRNGIIERLKKHLAIVAMRESGENEDNITRESNSAIVVKSDRAIRTFWLYIARYNDELIDLLNIPCKKCKTTHRHGDCEHKALTHKTLVKSLQLQGIQITNQLSENMQESIAQQKRDLVSLKTDKNILYFTHDNKELSIKMIRVESKFYKTDNAIAENS